MLQKRWLNVVHVLSAHCPCLSRDVQRCQRWPGQRLFRVALHGSVLIESGHGPSSGGYVHDVVPSDRTMVECDTAALICPVPSRDSDAMIAAGTTSFIMM